MTPDRTGKGRGNYRIELVLRGFGEFRASSGTLDPKEYSRRKALVKRLDADGRFEILEGLKGETLSYPEVIHAERVGRLSDLLADKTINRNLWDAIEDTLPRMKASENTKKRYAVAFRALQRKGKSLLPASARVKDLATMSWRSLEEAWGGSASDWMNLKTAVSAFVTTYLDGDVYHPFARKLRRTIPNRTQVRRMGRISMPEFAGIVSRTPVHAAPSYWVLAITGMRLGEYLATTKAHLDPRNHSVKVPGTKTKASEQSIYVDERLWPWIEAGVPSKLRSRWLRLHWKRAVKAAGFADIRLHDLRHCTGRWMIEAGVLEADAQRYLRHSNPDQTRDYVMMEATRHSSGKLADRVFKLAIHKEKKEEDAETA